MVKEHSCRCVRSADQRKKNSKSQTAIRKYRFDYIMRLKEMPLFFFLILIQTLQEEPPDFERVKGLLVLEVLLFLKPEVCSLTPVLAGQSELRRLMLRSAS